jgi:hypothetical protein
VVLEGKILLDKGPVDGLEVVACLEGGKTHESVIKLVTANGQLIKATFMTMLSLDDGVPVPELSPMPARGTPLRVQIQWQNEEKTWMSIDASSLVRDRIVDRPYPPVPFVYTGSRILKIEEGGPNGSIIVREPFMLDMTKSLLTNFNEPDALLASPFPGADDDQRFEVYSRICPPAGTPIRMVFSRVVLPLTLFMDKNGAILNTGTLALPADDEQVQAQLAKAYGEGATPNQRAVGVMIARDVPAETAQAVRVRLLKLAARAHCWVLPVFVLSTDASAK